MKGKHHIVIESARLKYEFDIKRNITIIRGDSATGKTTLIELLEDYRGGGEDSAVRISSDVPCRVFADSSDTWRQALEVIADSIIFILNYSRVNLLNAPLPVNSRGTPLPRNSR